MISNLIGMILARLVSPAVSFLIIVLVARNWGGELLGQYNTVMVWLIMFQYVSMLGISEYIVREAGSHKAKAADYLSHSLVIVLGSSVVCMLIMSAGALSFDYPEKVKYSIIIASLIIPFNACVLTCHAVFAAFQKIRLIAAASIAESLLFLLLGGAVVLKGYSLSALMWCLVTVRFFAVLLNLVMAGKHIAPLHFRIDWRFLRTMLPAVAVFGLTGIAFHIFMRADVIMISMMKDMATVGLYSSASKLLEICMMLPLTFYFLNLPVAADAYKNSNKEAHKKIEAGMRTYFTIILCIFLFFFVFAETILGMVYGTPFAGASAVLRILMAAFLIHSAEITLEMSCQAAGFQRAAMFIAVFRALINILLNLIFIPLWGAVGAALATLAAITLSFSAFLLFTKKTLKNFKWFYRTDLAKAGSWQGGP